MRLSAVEPRLHFTVRQPANILGIISGHFHSEFAGDQFLFNLETAFELHAFWQTHFTCRFRQPFLSLVYSVCLGPSFDSLDSFLAGRDDDLVLFLFEPAERLFVALRRVALPRLAKPAAFVHFAAASIFVSAPHGGFGVFDVTDDAIVCRGADKPCGCALGCCASGTRIFRVEAGPRVAVFDIAPFDRSRVYAVPRQVLSAHCFGSGVVVFFDRVEFLADGKAPVPSAFPQRRAGEENVLVWFKLGGLVRVGSGLRVTIVSDRLPVVPFRVLPIDAEHVLLANSVADHEIFDFVAGKVVGTLQSVICLSRSFSVAPAGGSGVALAPCSVLSVPMVGPARPSAMVVTSQGREVRVFSPFELPDFPNGLFQFALHNRRYVLFSFPGQSMLYKVSGRELVLDTQLGIDTSATTLDVSEVSKKGHSYAAQFTQRDFVLVSPSLPRDERKLPFDVIFVASNRCQLACSRADRRIKLEDASVSEPGQSDEYALEDEEHVTVIALSPPNAKGRSKYIVLGVRHERGGFLVRFTRFSTDPMFRKLHEKSIEDRVPYPVVSILLVGDAKPHRVLLGLDHGIIYFGRPDYQAKHLADIQSLRIGDGPVRFCCLGRTEILALCSRPCLLGIGARMRVEPLSCDSLSFAVPLGDPGLFLGVSGRLASCYRLTETSPVVIRPPVDPTLQAVSFCMIDGTRFVLIGHQVGLSLYDLASGRTYLAAKFVSRELVIQLSLPFPIQKPLGPPSAFLVAALGRAHGSSPSECIFGLRLFRVDAADSVPTVQQLGSLLIGPSRPASVSAAASGLVAFIVAAFTARVRLYRLQGDTFVVIAESAFPGSALRHVGVPSTRNPQLVVWAGHRSRSVSFLAYSEETRSFRVVAEEGFARVISAFTLDGRDIRVGDR
jgi:hypothetical protein